MRSPPEGAVPQPESQGPVPRRESRTTRPLAAGAASACTVLGGGAARSAGSPPGEIFLFHVVFKIELFPTSCVLGYPFPSVSK